MKNKFILSTIILITGGAITKILGMIIKIVTTRLIGIKGIGMYMLILPTFSLLISLSQAGIPLALSKLISEDKRNNKKLFFSNLPIIIIINLLLMIIILLFAPFISAKLLHHKSLSISIKAIAFVIPFTTISNICRSYFFGKQKMFPHVFSNIIEDLLRLLIIIIFLPMINSIKYQVLFLILINIISEVVSTVILVFFLPKDITITKDDLKVNRNYIKDSLKISIPNTTSKLIGSIAYFLEPIILMFFLSRNYSKDYIVLEYGILNGYVLPLILLPSFFSLAISQALLPVISKEYTNNNIKSSKKKLKLAVALSFIIGSISTTVLMFRGEILLKFIYHTKEGITYLKILSPVFLLQYIQAPLISSLDAINLSKINLYANIISTLIRTICLIILSTFKIGIYSLIISIYLNIIITTIYLIIKVKENI